MTNREFIEIRDSITSNSKTTTTYSKMSKMMLEYVLKRKYTYTVPGDNACMVCIFDSRDVHMDGPAKSIILKNGDVLGEYIPYEDIMADLDDSDCFLEALNEFDSYL